MRYKVKEIGEAGIDIRVELGLPWLTAECSDAKLSPSDKGLYFKGSLESVGEGYLLRGNLRGWVTGQCARCLEDAGIPIDLSLVFNFVEELPEEDEEEDGDEDERVLIENGVVDIGPTLRDELLIALPMSPICSETCLGICPSCGTNRNATRCSCSESPRADSKFSVLAKMKRE